MKNVIRTVVLACLAVAALFLALARPAVLNAESAGSSLSGGSIAGDGEAADSLSANLLQSRTALSDGDEWVTGLNPVPGNGWGKNYNNNHALMCIEPNTANPDGNSRWKEWDPVTYLSRGGADGNQVLEQIYACLQVGAPYNMGYWQTVNSRMNDPKIAWEATRHAVLHVMADAGLYELSWEELELEGPGEVYGAAMAYWQSGDSGFTLPGLNAEAVSSVLSQDGKRFVLTFRVTQNFVLKREEYRGYQLTLTGLPEGSGIEISSGGETKTALGSQFHTASLFTYPSGQAVTDTIVVTIPASSDTSRKEIAIRAEGYGAHQVNRNEVRFYCADYVQDVMDVGIEHYEESEEGHTAYAAAAAVTAALETPDVFGSFRMIKTDHDSSQPLEGVRFGLYEDASCSRLIREFATDANGAYQSENLPAGTYYLKEMGTREGYVLEQTVHAVSVSPGVNTDLSLTNERAVGQAALVKTDSETGMGLEGVVYGLYAAEDIMHPDGKTGVVYQTDALVKRVETDRDGRAEADGLYLGDYYWKEITPRTVVQEGYTSGYQKNEEVIQVRFSAWNPQQKTYRSEAGATNKLITGSVLLRKQDRETGTPQGDAVLEGAVYDIYARTDVIHPDGHTGTLYTAWKEGDDRTQPSYVGTLITDEEGYAAMSGLYPGCYLAVERTAGAGYLVNPQPTAFTITVEDTSYATVETECVAEEQVMKQPFALVKFGAGKEEDEYGGLAYAGFQAYLLSSLETNPDGSYDYGSAEPVILTADGKTELFTDQNGFAQSVPLPYGTYVVRETTVPQGYRAVRDFQVVISENDPDTPQTWRILLDEAFSVRLAVTKKDSVSGKAILNQAAEFRIYDLAEEKYLTWEMVYPKKEICEVFHTDETGRLAFPFQLLPGQYRIEEVTAPEGYLAGEPTVIEIYEGMAYRADQETGAYIVEMDVYNTPVTGTLEIIKNGEQQTEEGEDVFEMKPLEGAVFQLRAAEDIYAPDGQADEQEQRAVLYKEGELAATMTTDREGKASLTGLPLGRYLLEEIYAPEGYVTAGQPVEVVFEESEEKLPVVLRTISVENRLTKVEISKTDLDAGGNLPGACLTVTGSDGETVAEWITGTEPYLLCGLKAGAVYTLTETSPADGYATAEDILFTVENTEEIQQVEMKDAVIQVEILKKDENDEILPGARLMLLDSGERVLDIWVSGAEAYRIKGLVPGNYVLREAEAPEGYLAAEDMGITVIDTPEIQQFELINEKTEEPEPETEVPETEEREPEEERERGEIDRPRAEREQPEETPRERPAESSSIAGTVTAASPDTGDNSRKLAVTAVLFLLSGAAGLVLLWKSAGDRRQ